MNDKFDMKNGWLCVRSEMRMTDTPETAVSWYPIVKAYPSEFVDIVGEPAHYQGDGLYQGKYRGIGYISRFALTDGGQTKPIAHEIVPIPQPKVRKGIDVRYRHERWEKYLKSEGWVSA